MTHIRFCTQVVCPGITAATLTGGFGYRPGELNLSPCWCDAETGTFSPEGVWAEAANPAAWWLLPVQRFITSTFFF